MNIDEKNPRWELEINSEHRNRHENLAFDIDVWYPLFEDITFKTHFLPLSLNEARAISNYYAHRFVGKPVFTYDDVLILNSLENRIDNFINSIPSLKSNGAFLRLCGRSPKDGDPYEYKKIFNEYKSNLAKYEVIDKDKVKKRGTIKIHAIAKTKWLNIKTGKDALSLMLTSERVYYDMRDWERHGGKEQIVLREWEEGLDYDNEYRAFVYENKLAAITQYDHYGKYQHIIDEKDTIEKSINEFWKTNVKDRMFFTDYAIDFAYINGKVKMIELSPYLRCTGTAMYKWDRDGKELRYGEGHLRVNETEYDEIDDLADSWEDRWGQMDNFKDYYVQWSIYDSIRYYASYLNVFSYFKSAPVKYVFVVSVLKENFYWNKKYLSEGEKVKNATLKGYGIIIDENGMGWINKGDTAKGEIWKVKEDDLRDVIYFYGEDDCVVKEENIDGYQVTFVLKENVKGKEVDEYTKENEKKYDAIGSKVKIEEKYLRYSLRFPLDEKK